MKRRPIFKNSSTAAAVGVAAFLVGWACLYDAWEGRGGTTPKVLRAFTWW